MTFFPSTKLADKNGLLILTDGLNTDILIEAYSKGIFPWPWDNSGIIPWFSPPKRAIIDFSEAHFSQSLKKIVRKKTFEFSFNTNFSSVIKQCANSPTRSQKDTWISDLIIKNYTKLNEENHAISFECYQSGELVGGLYGVMTTYFSAESMFYTKSNASKACLFFAIEKLKELGHTWLDCQIMNNHLIQFGTKEISREEFEKRL